MLRLYDPREDSVRELRTAIPGVLCLSVSAGPADPADLGGLRVGVLADLVRRVVERRRLRVLMSREAIGRQAAEALEALNIRPAPLDHLNSVDLHVGPAGPPVARNAKRLLEVGPIRADDRIPAISPGALRDRGLDPLSFRLATLGRPYRSPLDLAWTDLDRADSELRRWRGLIAGWAESPSRPASADHLSEAIDAFGDDLDSPRALEVLRRLAADDRTPPGAKFETAVDLDLVLALDLVQDVGRSPA